MTDQDLVQKELSALLVQQFPQLDLRSNLLKQIDSIALVELIMVLEERYQISIVSTEMTDRNFAGIDSMTQWIVGKLEAYGNRKP